MCIKNYFLLVLAISSILTTSCEKEEEEEIKQPTACIQGGEDWSYDVHSRISFNSCSENATSQTWEIQTDNNLTRTVSSQSVVHEWNKTGEYQITIVAKAGSGEKQKEDVTSISVHIDKACVLCEKNEEYDFDTELICKGDYDSLEDYQEVKGSYERNGYSCPEGR